MTVLEKISHLYHDDLCIDFYNKCRQLRTIKLKMNIYKIESDDQIIEKTKNIIQKFK